MREYLENALALRAPETAVADAAPAPFASAWKADADHGRDHLRGYWRAVRKRLWVVFGLVTLVTTLTAVLMLRKPNLYEAEAQVQVDLEGAGPALGPPKNGHVVVNSSANDPAYFNTQLQILAGPNLLRTVVKGLDLEHNPAFLSTLDERSLWRRLERAAGLAGPQAELKQATPERVPLVSSAAAPSTREDLQEANRLAPFVEALQRDLRVEPVKESRLPVKETRLIEIRFSHPDPQLASQVVNAIADAFVLQNLEKKTKTGATSGDFLQKRIAELQSQMRGGEERLINYAKNHQIISLDASQNTVVERLAGLNRQLLDAENERKLSEAAFRAAQAPGAGEALAEEGAKSVGEIERKLAELEQRRAQLLVDNTEEWPEVKEADQQIAAVKRKLSEMRGRATSVVMTNLETRYRQSLQREEALRSAFNQQRGETLTQNEAAINYRIIQQEIETNKNLLDGLLQRAKENDVVLAGTPNNISVADYAITPRRAVGPQRLLAVVLAAALALAFGLCLAVLLEYLDNTVRSADDVEQVLHLPALALIPTVGSLARRRLMPLASARTARLDGPRRPELLINNETGHLITEAYKQLRTSILLTTAGRAPKTLLVASGQSGEGKTTTAVNMAISLAQTGAKVLVVDADLRRPAVHASLGMANVAGLSEALSREMSEVDNLSLIALQEESGLYVMTAGAIAPNPSELLGSSQMRHFIKTLELYFDFIVFDSSPLTSVTDGVLLASMVDGVILVVHGGRSTRDLVRRTRQILQSVGARVFGVVLNNVKPQREDYYQGYYGRPHATTVEKTDDLVKADDLISVTP